MAIFYLQRINHQWFYFIHGFDDWRSCVWYVDRPRGKCERLVLRKSPTKAELNLPKWKQSVVAKASFSKFESVFESYRNVNRKAPYSAPTVEVHVPYLISLISKKYKCMWMNRFNIRNAFIVGIMQSLNINPPTDNSFKDICDVVPTNIRSTIK